MGKTKHHFPMTTADIADKARSISSSLTNAAQAGTNVNISRTMGAVAGGLIGGLGLTAMLMADEKKSGKPSELVDLERAGARKLGLDVPPADQLPDAGEQAVVQAGHLLISLAAGSVYALTVKNDSQVVPKGVAFGLGLYTALHWITGPALGLKQPEWRSDAKTIGKHTLIHVLFGVLTAAGAKAATQVSGTRND